MPKNEPSDFDATFQEMVQGMKLAPKGPSLLKRFFSIVIGFLLMSVFFSVGVYLIIFGLGFFLPIGLPNIWGTLIIGSGLCLVSAIHLGVGESMRASNSKVPW